MPNPTQTDQIAHNNDLNQIKRQNKSALEDNSKRHKSDLVIDIESKTEVQTLKRMVKIEINKYILKKYRLIHQPKMSHPLLDDDCNHIIDLDEYRKVAKKARRMCQIKKLIRKGGDGVYYSNILLINVNLEFKEIYFKSILSSYSNLSIVFIIFVRFLFLIQLINLLSFLLSFNVTFKPKISSFIKNY